MISLLNLIDLIFSIIQWVVIISVVMSWLVAFGVVNMRNRVVYMIVDGLNRMTEPLFRPIRRVIPPMGGLDLAPLILLIGIWFIQSLLHEYAYPAVIYR